MTQAQEKRLVSKNQFFLFLFLCGFVFALQMFKAGRTKTLKK